MRISRNQLIAGYPALDIRTLFRSVRTYLTVMYTMHVLDLRQPNAERLLRRLHREGYLEKPFKLAGTLLWPLAEPKGLALCSSKAGHGIFRKTADGLVQQLLERVNTINQSPEYLWKITCLVVFGSYLTDAQRLGDLDVGVRFAPKIEDGDEFQRALFAQARQAQTGGRHFRNYFEFLRWPKQKVMLALKVRSRAISLHELSPPEDDWIFDQPHRVLFETQPTAEHSSVWAKAD